MQDYLAVDLGAESGRVVQGTLAQDRLTLNEIGRFINRMTCVHGVYYWNPLQLFTEIKKALSVATCTPISMGVDTWGVDFALLAADGSLLANPIAYRDPRTDGMMKKFFKKISKTEVYGRTGIQFLQFNTLYQLFAMSEANSPLLKIATDLLLIPDLFHYFFTGEKSTEFTNASTTQLLNLAGKDWDNDLLSAIGIDSSIMQKVVMPGSQVGLLKSELANETGLPEIPIIAPATHDTGSAVAAVPAQDEDWAYLSSGTWSLLGIESPIPLSGPNAMRFNFTNEGGVDGVYRILKNIAGLWLLQRCRAEFEREYSYKELVDMAKKAKPFHFMIDVADLRFINPTSMQREIIDYCHTHGQSTPTTTGEFVRCVLESLAMEYYIVLNELRQISGRKLNRIHVIGGGGQNELLCQLTANACGIPVLAGPFEATAIGNIMVQAIAAGHVPSLVEGRKIIANSFDIREYHPYIDAGWNTARERYLRLKEQK